LHQNQMWEDLPEFADPDTHCDDDDSRQ
jgi:hypothetical protein